MMLTCSALRCSVLEGSAISGTSDDPGADDPPAPKGIPNAVLYVTVDDETFAHVVRDFEHATDLAFDAPRDVRAGGRRELDRGEVLRPHDVEEARGPAAFRGRGGAPGGARPTLVQSMAAREDVTIRAGAVDDQERLSDGRELPREPMNRGRPGRPEMGLFRYHAAAELHEEHAGRPTTGSHLI